MAYLWVLRGDPLYFSHVQEHWGRHFAPPWVSVQHSIKLISEHLTPQVVANQALELTFTALMIAVLVLGFRRLRASYIAYMALSILVPMSTGSLMSMPRFALVLFPIFILFGLWGGEVSMRQQRHPRLLDAAAGAFYRPVRGLVLGRVVTRSMWAPGGFAQRRGVRQFVKFGIVGASGLRRQPGDLHRAAALRPRPRGHRPVPRDLLDRVPLRRRVELLP